jgi:MFS family permease
MHHHIHDHHLHLIKDEISEVYLNLIMQSFGISLIAVFVPIYLIQLGYSLNQALLFVMVELGTLSLFSPFAAMMAKRWGFKHIVLYRLPLMIYYFIGLYALNFVSFPIYLIAFGGGISGSMYWVSMHSLFAKYSNRMHRGSQAGKLISIPNLCSMIGPTIGGLIAVAFGFKVLLIISIIMICIATLPLFYTPDMKPHITKFSFSDMFDRKHLKFIARFAAQGTIAIAGVIVWPIFVYFMLEDVASVGFMVTTTALGVVIFTVFIGRLSDRISRFRIIKIGGILVALTFFARIFATDMAKAFAVSFLAGLFTVLIDLPILAYFYDKANRENTAEIVVLRELGLGVGRILTIVILLFVLNKFAVGFSLGGFASLMFSLI